MTSREGCLFCRIAALEEPADVLLATDTTVVFRDATPVAPVHLLVIPRAHLRDILELGDHPEAAQGVLSAINQITRELGIRDFRTVFNTGVEGGQHVFHVHAHVLSGRFFGWPPG